MAVRQYVLFAAALALTVSAQAQAPSEEMTWTTLGTQAGPIASAERAQPANLLLFREQVVLVDAGDGAAGQLAKAGVALPRLGAVFLSHLHHDHAGGLAAVIGLRYQLGVAGVLRVYGPPGTRELVDGITRSLRPLSRIGSGMASARPGPETLVEVREIRGGDTLLLGSLTVTAAENTHYSERNGAGVPGDPASLSLSLSFRFNTPTRSIVYTGDTGPSAAVERLARRADLLVSEMLDMDAQVAVVRRAFAGRPAAQVDEVLDHIRRHHLTPEQVGALAARARVGRLVVTHLGPGTRDAGLLAGYRRRIATAYKGPTAIANDLDRF